jgi:hypothetical protein
MNELKHLAEESETERERERRPSLCTSPPPADKRAFVPPVAKKLRGKEGERGKEESGA